MRNINILLCEKKTFCFLVCFCFCFCFLLFVCFVSVNPSGLPMSREGFARAPAARELAVPLHL